MISTDGIYHFKCMTCQFDDVEAGRLARESEIYCPICAEDQLAFRLLLRWRDPDPLEEEHLQ